MNATQAAASPDNAGAAAKAASGLAQADGLSMWGNYFQALGLLFLIVALLWVALWYFKRRGGFNLLTRQGELCIENRLALGPKKSLIVVRFLNKRVLLGISDQQITMLTELPTDEDHTPHPLSVPEKSPDFKEYLEKSEQRDTEA